VIAKQLVETYPKVLVEANRHDNFWAIGLAASDVRARDSRTWQGRNQLGKLLTELRERLMAGP
jgi:ribA/ribD-fused uncharacterized protein